MEGKKLLWLVEAEGREITPTSWWWELKAVDPLSESENRLMSGVDA